MRKTAVHDRVRGVIRMHAKLITFLQRYLNEKQFLIISSVLVGISSALAAIILKALVFYIHRSLYDQHIIKMSFIFYAFLPLAGILITAIIIKKNFHGNIGGGNAEIIHSIDQKQSRLPASRMFSHILTSAITVGAGGSTGLETPIVTTGAAIGSNYGKTYKVSSADRTLLLASGVAAGIAAAFNAPVAGVLFALEVLVTNISISAFIPLLIAAASGAILSKIILNEDILLTFHLQQPFDYTNVPMYILLGIITGIVSVYYIRSFIAVEHFFLRIKKTLYIPKALLGGLLLAGMILLFPALAGEGYTSIKLLADQQPELTFQHSLLFEDLSEQWALVLCIGLIILIKSVATGITLGSGGNGGNFAPSLFLGAYLGFLFATLFNMLGIKQLPVSNFTIVAMGGILSGVFHAPLTGIFLIAEITGGYELMIPLMLVSASSFAISKYINIYSLDGIKLKKAGKYPADNFADRLFSKLDITGIIEKDFTTVYNDSSLRVLINLIPESRRNIFPVIDRDGKLKGIIPFDVIRPLLFDAESYDDVTIAQLMQMPPAVVDIQDDPQSILNVFDKTNAWNLPVTNKGVYIGYISKSSVFDKYRQLLKNNSL